MLRRVTWCDDVRESGEEKDLIEPHTFVDQLAIWQSDTEPLCVKVMVGTQTAWLHWASFSRALLGIKVQRRVVYWIVGCFAIALLPACNQSNSITGTSEPRLQPSQQVSPLAQMREAAKTKDWSVADEFADAVLIAHSADPDIIAEVARVKALSGNPRGAALLAVEAASVDQFRSSKRVQFAIAALVQVGDVYAAIDLMQQYLMVHPSDSVIRRTLVGFLGEAERYDLMPEHMKQLIAQRAFDAPLLVVTTENSSRRFARESASTLRDRNPDDLRISLASGRQKMIDGDFPAAEKLLREIVDRHQRFAPAHAMLGQALVASGASGDQLADWLASATAGSRDFADYWLTVADIAQQAGNLSAAARGYWEATRRDPNSSTAWTRLLQCIEVLRATSSGIPSSESAQTEPVQSEPVQSAAIVTDEELADIKKRIAMLLELRRRFYDFSGGGRQSQRDASLVAESLYGLGRYWEAEAWSAIAVSLTQDPSDQLKDLRDRIVKRLKQERDWIGRKHFPALRMNLSQLPNPESATLDQEHSNQIGGNLVVLAPNETTSNHITLQDEADRWGLNGVGAGHNPLGIYLSIVRTTGAGAGAIDFDLDGWADLLVVGAGGTIGQQDSPPNRLLRNLQNRFSEVTPVSGIDDASFGQGVAAGDYNADGFADLLFTNLGGNRLFRNNGDGSFTECSGCLPKTAAFHWSTSGALADINGDGLPDWIISNYCELGDQWKRIDGESEKDVLGFHPLDFPSQADTILMANGDGTFADQSSQWMQGTSYGRGLGVLCGQLVDGRFGVFVANDMSSNNYYDLPLHRSTPDSVAPVDSGAARGLAVNAQTLTQASMGIANGDLDGDGDFDLYVTGFAREHNILYEQIAPGLWQDRTHLVQLVQPSHMMVAFGSEAIDTDNDGIDELLVTNGGIGDEQTSANVPYQQPFQIFRRSAQGTFQELDDDAWGRYFAQDHVGRSMLSADFDRDGAVDALVTHNYEPVALLMNRTQTKNHFVRFRLVGTQTSRDAIGAVVRFRSGGRPRTLWAVSGDGYLCSNEPILHAGLGNQDRVEEVTVTWRDGTVESFGDLAADQVYLLVQGDQVAFELK